MRTRLAAAAVALLVLASGRVLRAEGPGPEIPRSRLEAIEGAISSEMARQGIPGLSIAIGQGGSVRFTSGYGLADLENSVPARAATVYRLASISKPMTAVAALQLAERGALDLDAPVQKYVPAFPEKAWPVTARQLLGHLGGVRHYRDDEPTNTRPYESLDDSLAFFKDDALVAEPGARFVYSTYGYNLVGAAVEGAAGKPFVEVLKEGVFAPAGLTAEVVVGSPSQ